MDNDNAEFDEPNPEEIIEPCPGHEPYEGAHVTWECPGCRSKIQRIWPMKSDGQWLTCPKCKRAVHVMTGPNGTDFQTNLEWPES
jgi:hypothetical protein